MLIDFSAQAIQEWYRRSYQGLISMEVKALEWRRVFSFEALHPFNRKERSYLIFLNRVFFLEISNGVTLEEIVRMTPAKWFLLSQFGDIIYRAVCIVDEEYVSDAYRRLGFYGTSALLKKFREPRPFKGRLVATDSILVKSEIGVDYREILQELA